MRLLLAANTARRAVTVLVGRRPGLKMLARRPAGPEDRDVASAAASYTATGRARRETGSNTKRNVI